MPASALECVRGALAALHRCASTVGVSELLSGLAPFADQLDVLPEAAAEAFDRVDRFCAMWGKQDLSLREARRSVSDALVVAVCDHLGDEHVCGRGVSSRLRGALAQALRAVDRELTPALFGELGTAKYRLYCLGQSFSWRPPRKRKTATAALRSEAVSCLPPRDIDTLHVPVKIKNSLLVFGYDDWEELRRGDHHDSAAAGLLFVSRRA
mmetsp:Transcript_61021/g.175800  ORF Transcript_61021/g.175800 Transcript_61021/m.175800 type:complete len:210 (-) Transcript_61021:243-872(-)